MAVISDTYTRYTAKGLRERLSDVIYDITPTETPIVSGAGRHKVDQTLFEWQTDALAATDTGNAHIDGDDVTTFPSITPTVRVGNYTQISRKLMVISGTLEAVNKAGRASELGYQAPRRGREIKRDMEAIVTANLGGDAGGTATPRQTATLGAWLKTNTDFNTGDGGDPVYTSGVPSAARTDGTPRALTETIFTNVLESAWTNGANVDAMTVYVGAHVKGVINTFNGNVDQTFNINDTPKASAIISAANVYVSDFGTVRIALNRFQRGRDAWFIDPEYVSIAILRPFQTVKLAKTGDAEKRMLLQEWGLCVKQEAALGGAFDLSDGS